MSTFFATTDEANCHVSTENAFILVDPDDVTKTFSHSLVTMNNPTSVLASAYVRLN
jgi:hypothetical protein